MNVSWRVSVCPSGTGLGNEHFWKMYIVVWWMSGVVDVWCGGCPMWWMSGVLDVRCGGCLVWWMSYFTHSVVDVWCGGCLVWWMSYFTHGVVDVWCGGCLVWWMSGVVDVQCGGCLILHTVWWMSGVVDVCVVDVVQSNRTSTTPDIHHTTMYIFQKCTFPNPVPEGHTETLQLKFIPQLLA